jgi:AcrR family transcriptional regulator
MTTDSTTPTNEVGNKSTSSRHEEVLDAGLRVFASKGYRGATIEDIAKELGFTSAALYYYIKSKQDLLLQTVNRPIDSLIESANQIESLNISSAEKLTMLIENHVLLAIERRDWFTVMLRDQSHLPESNIVELRNRDKHYRQLLVKLIIAGNESGEFAVKNPGVCSMVIVGALNWTLQWVQPDGVLNPKAVAQEIAATLLNGIVKK